MIRAVVAGCPDVSGQQDEADVRTQQCSGAEALGEAW
jgi:hypothetical protein